MTPLYPEIEPYDSGLLDVSDGHAVYWETSGNPAGKPALVVHGGPGSGSNGSFRRLFDPSAYRIVQLDQRSCGRSTPHAGDPATDLARNTTRKLVGDIEALRKHLEIERWLLLGGSWGSTLALACAQAHVARVSALILFSVTTGRHVEFDWTFRGGLARFFPEQWARLEAGAGAAGEGDIVDAYHRLLADGDPAVRARAAAAWCAWESATVAWPPETELAPRFRDPRFALAFARIVTHYVRHNAWLDDGELLRQAATLAEMPGILINARLDLQAPLQNAWRLKEAWPAAQLVVVDGSRHGATGTVERAIVEATDRFRP